MEEPPAEVRELAERRAAARAEREFATADALRARIAERGWQVRDVPHGYELVPAPPYPVHPTVDALPDRTGHPDTRRATVALLVEGWPDDLRSCARALLAHAPRDVVVAGLDLGTAGTAGEDAGDSLHELAVEYPGRVEEWHVSGPANWGRARTALLRADTAAVHIVMDTSTILEGDVLTPLLRCFDDPSVVGAGWRGAAVDDGWHGFHDCGPGEVEALLGYLFAVRRGAANSVGGFSRSARYYRNADLEFSLALRDAGLGRLVVPDAELPVRQARHRGYHDTDPILRERESKRNYDRLLARFRGREDLRLR